MTVIRFSGGSTRPPRISPTHFEFRETPRQRAGRRRNPLRQDADRISLAVTIAGKLANGRADQLQVLQGWGDYVAMLRRGAETARLLAAELDLVAREEEASPPVA